MSQEKVDRYKKEKANRKEILKKEKRNRMITRIGGGVVCAALIGWIGWSAYSNLTADSPVSQTEVNLESIQNYLTELDPGE